MDETTLNIDAIYGKCDQSQIDEHVKSASREAGRKQSLIIEEMAFGILTGQSNSAVETTDRCCQCLNGVCCLGCMKACRLHVLKCNQCGFVRFAEDTPIGYRDEFIGFHQPLGLLKRG